MSYIVILMSFQTIYSINYGFPESKGLGTNAIEKRVVKVDAHHVSDSKEKAVICPPFCINDFVYFV